MAHKHLSRQKIDPLLYMTEWFMCAFARTLPWSSVLRVWDMFFCEGTGLGLWGTPLPLTQPTGSFCFQRNSLQALLPPPHAGVKIIFRVGLVLLKHALGSPEKLKACQGQYETIEQLRSLSPKIMQEAFLVQEVRPTPSHHPGWEWEMWGPFRSSLVTLAEGGLLVPGLVLSSSGWCG